MSVAQDQLTQAILAPDLPVPEGLSDGQGRAATKRFAVYRNNVAVSLTEALIAAFPTIHGLVGDEFFRAMAGVFLRQHPPTSPLMMFYGSQMPGFLFQFEPVAHLPYLPDVARIELSLREAYHAEDAEPLAPESLALEPDALMATRFEFAPAVRIIRSRFPAYSIWKMHRGGPKPAAKPQDVLISRPKFDPEVDLLLPGAADFLEALMAGATIANALEKASDLNPTEGFGPTLSLALQRGIFTRLT
ncbi:MAG: putative DNA-binding domain-containing protein [Pseudomonadota bacterium]